MSEKIQLSSLRRFDAAEHLKSDADITEYLTAIIEEGDESLLASALGDVAKARGMTAIAASSGITREALYRALRPGAKPRYDTIQKVMKALGYRISLQKISA